MRRIVCKCKKMGERKSIAAKLWQWRDCTCCNATKPLQGSHCKEAISTKLFQQSQSMETLFFLIFNSSLFVSRKNSDSIVSLSSVFNISEHKHNNYYFCIYTGNISLSHYSQAQSILRPCAIFSCTYRKNSYYYIKVVLSLDFSRKSFEKSSKVSHHYFKRYLSFLQFQILFSNYSFRWKWANFIRLSLKKFFKSAYFQ